MRTSSRLMSRRRTITDAAGRRLAVTLCFAMGVIEGFDIQIVGVTAPAIAAALDLRPTDLSWVFLASNLGILLGAVAGGLLADRVGRRPVLIAAAVVFGGFTLAIAAVEGFAGLLVLRLVAGVGLGAALPLLVATAADVTEPARRGFATGLMFCGVPLGGASVALLSQALPAGVDWRALFVLGGMLPLLIGALQWLLLPETVPEGRLEARAPVARTLFGDGRARSTLLLWIAVAPTLMTLYLVLYWLPTLVLGKGLPAGVAAQASAAFNLAGVAGALAIGWSVDRWPRQWVLAGCYWAFVIVALLLAGARGGGAVLLLSAAAGFLLLGLNYAVYGLASALYPDSDRATGSGAAIGVGRLGSIVGPVVPGFLLAGGTGSADILWLLAPTAAVAGLAVAALTMPRGRIA